MKIFWIINFDSSLLKWSSHLFSIQFRFSAFNLLNYWFKLMTLIDRQHKFTWMEHVRVCVLFRIRTYWGKNSFSFSILSLAVSFVDLPCIQRISHISFFGGNYFTCLLNSKGYWCPIQNELDTTASYGFGDNYSDKALVNNED